MNNLLDMLTSDMLILFASHTKKKDLKKTDKPVRRLDNLMN